MKKLFAFIMCCVITLSFGACSRGNNGTTEPTQTTPAPTEPTQEVTLALSDDVKKEIEDVLENFKGIVYLTQNGNLIYSKATGKDENGADLTVESPMYIGSVSKQFCATAVMLLKEQGKLSVDDTLDKYFPEYELGKYVTIKNLLSMRSGIPEMLAGIKGHSADKTESENIAIIKDWIFEQDFENYDPDTYMEYSNTNYFLLGLIVEMVSGQHYNDFVRENIFEPLSMDNTGFVNEVKDNPFFSKSLTYNTFTNGEDAEGLTKGAGDVVSTAVDMDKWMTALRSGKIVSEESYSEMITNHSPGYGEPYGYGLMGMHKNGTGHTGGIGDYVSVNYFNEEYGYNLFAVTTESPDVVVSLPYELINILVGD